MNRLAFLLFVSSLCFSVIPALSQKSVDAMKWQEKQVVLDGNPNEFCELPRFYDSNSKLYYEFRNDNENIYFIFYSNDRITNMKLLSSGLTLTVDTVKVKKKCSNIISFKMPHPEQDHKNPEKQNGENEDSRRISRHQPGRDTVIPEIFISGLSLAENSDQKISACFFVVRDSLFSGEVQIPVKLLYKNNSGILNFVIKTAKLEMSLGPPTEAYEKSLGNSEQGALPDRIGGNVSNSPDDRPSSGFPDGSEGPSMRPPGGGDMMPFGDPNEQVNFGEVKIVGKLKLACDK